MMAVKVLWPMLRRTNGRFAMLSGCGCPVHNAVKKSLSTVMVWSLQHEKDRCGRKDNIQSNEIYVKITYQRKIERMPLLAPEAAVAEQLSCDVWFVSTYVRLCLCLHVRWCVWAPGFFNSSSFRSGTSSFSSSLVSFGVRGAISGKFFWCWTMAMAWFLERSRETEVETEAWVSASMIRRLWFRFLKRNWLQWTLMCSTSWKQYYASNCQEPFGSELVLTSSTELLWILREVCSCPLSVLRCFEVLTRMDLLSLWF